MGQFYRGYSSGNQRLLINPGNYIQPKSLHFPYIQCQVTRFFPCNFLGNYKEIRLIKSFCMFMYFWALFYQINIRFPEIQEKFSGFENLTVIFFSPLLNNFKVHFCARFAPYIIPNRRDATSGDTQQKFPSWT